MRHQVKPNSPRVSLFDPSVVTSYHICPHSRDVYGRGNAIHPHHRVGHDGQDEILPAQHVVLVLGQMLPVPPDSDQDSPPSAKTKSHVQWYDRRL